MRLTKLITALMAAMLLLSACSTVKLDEAPSIETRKTSSVSQAEGSDANKASNSGDPNAARSDAASSADGISTTGTNSGTNADANASGKANSSFNDPLSDPSSILANRSIYFDLDSFIVRDEYKSVIDAHGKYLASRPDRKVIIQGNTDERGGSEYNLALGQKRADAVRRALAQRGVPESQMEAVSYGKEKPKALGSNEEAWKENRRADIAY
jgi:peptidoglycan-associated lipoprotein